MDQQLFLHDVARKFLLAIPLVSISNTLNRKFMKRFVICITLLLLLVNKLCLKAAETQTNCNWITFCLSIPKTNLIAGDKVLASMVCSNSLEVGRYLYRANGDPCGPGFGDFRVVEMTSGKKNECKFPSSDRTPHSYRLDILEGHKSCAFQFDLADVYALTNAGVYIIQASGRFTTNELNKKPDRYFNVVTPPLVMSLSPKVETNTPTK
jgi:hypothetical protein